MKNNLLVLLALIAFLFSCKKENNSTVKGVKETETSKQLYPVSFNVSEFTATSQKLMSTNANVVKTSALKDQIKYLQYFVFSRPDVYSNYKVIRNVIQKSTDAKFGTIKDSLPAGDYKVTFLGTTAEGLTRTRYKISEDYDLVFFYKDTTVKETYSTQLNLNVKSNIDSAVVLTHAVGKVTVSLQDAIPAGVASIKLLFDDFTTGFDLETNDGDQRGHIETDPYPTAVFTYPVTSSDIGKTGFTISKFAWPYAYFAVTVQAYDNKGTLIATKTLPKNLLGYYTQVKANTEYKFTGKLFADKETFNVSIDTTWKEAPTQPFGTTISTQ